MEGWLAVWFGEGMLAMAIGVAFIYSLAALFLAAGMDFFWELVTLIDVMLLGHWKSDAMLRYLHPSHDPGLLPTHA